MRGDGGGCEQILVGYTLCGLAAAWHAAFPMRQNAGWDSSQREGVSSFPVPWLSLPKVAGTFFHKESTQ